MTKSFILYRNVKIPLEFHSKEYHDTKACEYVKKIYTRQLKGSLGDADFFVYKKSVDARKTDKICFISQMYQNNETDEMCVASLTYPGDLSYAILNLGANYYFINNGANIAHSELPIS